MYEHVDDCEKHDVFYSWEGRGRVDALADFHELNQHEERKNRFRDRNYSCLMDGLREFIGANTKQGVEWCREHVGTADFHGDVVIQVESPT